MAKLPPPKAPKKRKSRRSGLEDFFDEEPATKKMRVLPPVPELVSCPACNGSTFSRIEECDGPRLGQYYVEQCIECSGRGQITLIEAEQIKQKIAK